MADLYPYLILIGLSIIAATGYLLRQARRRAAIASELVSLNENLNFDLPDFLRGCWTPLQKAGFLGLHWELNWFGSHLERQEGSEAEVRVERMLEVEDIQLKVTLFDGGRRFEQRYFSAVLSESFFLLLYTDMWVKLGTVQGAFAQAAKLSVFLQHDMKNIVQLVSLMADQLESTPAGKEQQILEAMRTVVPTLQERSERFLNTLSRQVASEKEGRIDVHQALEESAELHELQIDIQGGGEAALNEQAFNSVVDNLFGNYADQWRRDPQSAPELEARIVLQQENIQLSIRDRKGLPCLWPERLFEPFWSEKGDGLGIGLYHARQLISGAGGSLTAQTPADGPITFLIRLPLPEASQQAS